MAELQDHPLASIFPLMGERDLADLAADIEANGQRGPIWLLDGKILDGRNRYRACRSIDYDVRVEHYRGKDPLGFIISKNLHRRQLKDSQRAMVAAEIAKWKVGDNQHTAGGSANFRTHAQAAEMLGVSTRSVETAAKVRSQGTSELVALVERNEVSVSAAAVVAGLPKREQQAVVKAGPAAVKAKAREVREAKREERQPEPERPKKEPEPEPEPEPPADLAPFSHPCSRAQRRFQELFEELLPEWTDDAMKQDMRNFFGQLAQSIV